MSLHKQAWAKLNPNQKRMAVIASGVVALGVFAYLVVGNDEPRQIGQRRVAPEINKVLTDRNIREISIDAMAARIDRLEEERRGLESQVLVLRRAIEKGNGVAAQREENEALQLQLQQVQRQMDEMAQRLQQWQAKVQEGSVVAAERDATADVKRLDADVEPPNRRTEPRDGVTSREFYASSGQGDAGDGEVVGSGQAAEAGAKVSSTSGPSDIRVVTQEEGSADDAPKADAIPPVYIPPTAILSATMITGLDAPTNVGSNRQPFPALARIQKEAILPNGYTADIVDCHVLMEGYGELSSERAYLRGTTLACINTDGDVLESPFPAFGVGEDGKAGIRGRLVSKQGAVLAKALTAGFLQGVAQAFDTEPVPILQTTTGGSTNRSSVPAWQGEETLRSAGVSGVGNALERLAQFYIDQAAQMYPVLEVDAGRQIDLVSTSGMRLSFTLKNKEAAVGELGNQIGKPNTAGQAAAGVVAAGKAAVATAAGGRPASSVQPATTQPPRQ